MCKTWEVCSSLCIGRMKRENECNGYNGRTSCFPAACSLSEDTSAKSSVCRNLKWLCRSSGASLATELLRSDDLQFHKDCMDVLTYWNPLLLEEKWIFCLPSSQKSTLHILHFFISRNLDTNSLLHMVDWISPLILGVQNINASPSDNRHPL